MSRSRAILFVAAAAAFAAPLAHADYAVLRSGARIHITGYEESDGRITLNFQGGSAQIDKSELVSIEPEDQFQSVPQAPEAEAGPFDNLIHAAALKNGLDEKLIRRVIAEESNFNPRAVSRKNAQGLMQLLPETAARYAVADIFDPAQNIEAGTHYLKDLLVRYSGDLKLALAAYNAGPDVVDRYAGVPPYPETKKYVTRITASLAQDNTKN